jgi:large subunit ribosomal protein L23
MKDIVLRPRISEKAYGQSQRPKVRTYVFEVDKKLEKITIKRAVEAQFDVTVTNVNTVNQKGKAKMSYRKRVRPLNGKRSDIKKAYVTLKEGQELPIFVEEAKAQAEEVSRAAKAAKKGKK